MTATLIAIGVISFLGALMIIFVGWPWLVNALETDPDEPTLEQLKTDWDELVAQSKNVHSGIDRRFEGERRASGLFDVEDK